MLRIGLRVISNPAWMGGVNYVLTWLHAAATLDPADRPQMHLLYMDPMGREIAEGRAHLCEAIAPFADASSLDLDLVYPATQVFEAPRGAPWAAWIPDWQCRHLPEMFDAVEWARRDLHYRFLATRSPALGLSSDMALEDTRRIVGEAVVPAVRLPFPAMIGDGILEASEADVARARERHDVPERYVLVCNQFWKHKNHVVLLEALARLGTRSPVCVLTGDRHDERWPDYGREIDALVEARGLAPRLRFVGAVERRDQLLLMRGALAVIQPSRFEGWSTVVEEARALGKRLVMSDFPVHLEQSPPGARYFRVDSSADLSAALTELDEVGSGQVVPLDEAREAYRERVRACAEGMLELARLARRGFDSERHDYVRLLSELVREASSYRGTPAGDELCARVTKLARARGLP